jgi:hypothetical protein
MKSGKIISVLLIASMLLGLAATLPALASVAGDQGEVKIIDPVDGDSKFIFDTNNASTSGPLSTFKAEVWFYPNTTVNATQNVKGFQVQVKYNTTLVNCVTAVLPAGYIFDGIGATSSPPPVIDNSANPGSLTYMCILISDTANVSIPKILTEITFKIMLLGSKAVPFLSANFTFQVQPVGGTYMIQGNGIRLYNLYTDAYYQMSWVAPTKYPYLEVAPTSHLVTATALYQILDVPIWIKNCSAGWEQIGIQFSLWYNSSVISFVGSGLSPAYKNGTFVESFVIAGGNDSMGVFYIVRADFEGALPSPPGAPSGQNYFKVMILELPNASAKWNPPYMDGNGLIITLRINATAQAMYPIALTSPLEIRNVTFIDRDGHKLNQTTHISGTYKIVGKSLGRKIDIFTQYPYPYGGQGLGEPSDMFWPQKEVIMYANVTYNDWPEQFKDVAFQFIDPHGLTWAVVYGVTNSSGIATVSIRLPWPCAQYPNVIGNWTVIGTVDVACTIVNDTLKFKYDFLVHIFEVTLDKENDLPAANQYKHCEWINATITLGSYRMQNMSIIVTMTGFDETGVPFSFAFVEIPIGGATFTEDCHYDAIFPVPLRIHVEKFARAGENAWLHIGALSDWPIDLGDSLGIAFNKPFAILAE